jgi:hypothetical protein
MLRLLFGIVLALVLLAGSFVIAISQISAAGASSAEVMAAYPGDELVSQPVVLWTHGLTINAPPEQVWAWIAQMGDARGGFYSYTFIENLIAGYDLYHNAERIMPEFQNPTPGTSLITNVMAVEAVNPGEYMLGNLIPDGMFGTAAPGMGWSWAWTLRPEGENQTRLVVRMRISTPPGASNPVLTQVINMGGWVMERNMMDGIRDRAEGYIEPAWFEPVEIGIWLVTLLLGIAGAVFFVSRRRWQIPLLVGAGSILALVLDTFVQPGLLIRLAMILLLAADLYVYLRPASAPQSQLAAQSI